MIRRVVLVGRDCCGKLEGLVQVNDEVQHSVLECEQLRKSRKKAIGSGLDLP